MTAKKHRTPPRPPGGRAGPSRRLLAFAIGRIRPGGSYSIDPAIGGRSLVEVVTGRGLMFLRGSLRRPLLGRCGGFLFLGRGVRLRHAHQLRLGRGVLLQDGVTIDALSAKGVSLGDGVTIGRGSAIVCTAVLRSLGQGITIGARSALGDQAFLGAAGGIAIGANVICGVRVSFHAENHRYADRARPIRDQGVTREGITVEDDCWLGSGVIVLDGVRIGRGSVVAAGSVVTKSIPPGSIAAGVPAKVIGARSIGGEGGERHGVGGGE